MVSQEGFLETPFSGVGAHEADVDGGGVGDLAGEGGGWLVS